jgi:hypothetical protein
LQHERCNQSRRQDAGAGSGVKQAEQEIRPLGTRLRDRGGQRRAADESARCSDARQQSRKAQHDKIA